MDEESPAAVATEFLERFGDGAFDEANDLIHPEGPLDGAGEIAMAFSMLATDFLVNLVLGAVPTAVVEATVVEEGPTTADVRATLDVAGFAAVDAAVELRPGEAAELRPGERDERGGTAGGRDERAGTAGGPDEWAVWNVDLDSWERS